MKICNQAVLLSMVALSLAACSDDNPWWGNEGEGGIALKLEASADVKDAIPVLRSGADALEAPDAKDFSISLTNLATEEVQKFPTLADFQAQSGFRTGSYTLAAYYGDVNDEGFDKPYFYGETEVTVLEARNTEASITATLGNSMVSVDYTDAFRNYFKAYKATVHSEGHGYIDFEADETRAAFIAPGEVQLAIDVTNPSGKSATLQPAAFPAQAAHHYHITFDVASGNMGDAQLQIIFDDSLEVENVEIDLTDELFSSPAPKVNTVGFENDGMVEALSGNASEDQLRFEVVARGGITSAVLTISGDGFTPAFGNEIDLVKATPAQQDQIKALGIDVKGLYKNPETLAYVDVTNLAKHLPDGVVAVSLVVKDPFTRISEPATLNISTVPVVLNSTPGSAILNSGQATVYVDYNGAEPEKNISFQALAKVGVYKNVEILSVTESTRTRSFDTKSYVFTITLPDTDREAIPVKVFFNGVEKQSVNVPVVIPEYDVEVDAFATYAKLKVTPKNTSDMASVVNCLKLYNGNSGIAEAQIKRNNETGMVTVTGLTPASTFNLGHGLVGSTPAKTVSVTTEAAADVPNGDFSQTWQPSNLLRKNIEVGGGVKVFGTNTTIKSTIDRYEPAGWATINALTCASAAYVKTENTWFCVPSTYVDNGAVVIRNVGYDHNGTKPADYGSAFNTQYYNTNTPAFGEGKQAAGELFLGSYNEGESRVDGVSFASRPASLTFDYSYAPKDDDKAAVSIEVLDASGAVIASASSDLASQSSMKSATIPLPGYAFGKKAVSLRVKFISSTASLAPITIPTGSALNEGVSNLLDSSKFPGANAYKAFASGSVLTIDNVKLNY